MKARSGKKGSTVDDGVFAVKRVLLHRSARHQYAEREGEETIRKEDAPVRPESSLSASSPRSFLSCLGVTGGAPSAALLLRPFEPFEATAAALCSSTMRSRSPSESARRAAEEGGGRAVGEAGEGGSLSSTFGLGELAMGAVCCRTRRASQRKPLLQSEDSRAVDAPRPNEKALSRASACARPRPRPARRTAAARS